MKSLRTSDCCLGVRRGRRRVAAPAQVAATLAAAAAPAAPVARAAGGDAARRVYPSVVNVRLVRTQQLLAGRDEAQDRATRRRGQGADRAPANLRKAWAAAKYVIDNAPPPVAGDDVGRAPQ